MMVMAMVRMRMMSLVNNAFTVLKETHQGTYIHFQLVCSLLLPSPKHDDQSVGKKLQATASYNLQLITYYCTYHLKLPKPAKN